MTADESCPDLIHTEVPGKKRVSERRYQRVWKHTLFLLNWCDVLIQTHCQYSSSKEEQSLSPRKLKQCTIQGKKTNNNTTNPVLPLTPSLHFLFLLWAHVKAKTCKTAQTSNREKAWSWPLGNHFLGQEARQNLSIKHENCLTFFSSTTKLLVLPIGLKKSLY